MKYLKSILSVFLAFVLLLGILSPSVLSVKGRTLSDGERIQLTEIDPTFDPRLKDLFVRSDGTVEQYQTDDIVRVSIVLEKEPAIEKGYSIKTIGRSKSAANYRKKLEREQDTVTGRIEKNVLDGKKLDVVTNLTLVANLISADVKYGQIEEIEKVSGVKEVVIEQVYEPFEADEDVLAENSASMAKAMTQYTGAGARIAIIDSGVNHDHEAFNPDALEYSLRQSAPDIDDDGTITQEELDEYKDSLNFIEEEDVDAIIKTGNLHAAAKSTDIKDFYRSSKIPFAYNYCDNNFKVGNAEAGFHGSHVSGIAAANAYLLKDEKFVRSDENGGIIGTAPDAQILNLKVMGAGACTDSVIATAIEDAVVLGADVMNLSLGISEVGFSCAGDLYGDVLDNLSEKGILVLGAIGNDGSWLNANQASTNKYGRPSKLYAEDVNMSTTTPPSSYAEFMGVAWANGKGLNGQRADIEAYSAYGIPSSLMLQPEITAAGTKINSVEGNTNNKYAELSGTSMASPDVAGAAAVVNQYISTAKESFGGSTFLLAALAQSKKINKGMLTGGLLMSTADPMKDANDRYYSLLRQGAGLLNTKNASAAKSFIEVVGQNRGRVKAEVGDSPDGKNIFKYSFTLHNVSDQDRNYTLKTDLFTEDTVVEKEIKYLADYTRPLLGKTTYAIGDKAVEFSPDLKADVDKNGVTDYNDAQALLDYLSGKRDGDVLNLDAADMDGDKVPTTYDAHMILKKIEDSSVLVAANSSITVDVTIEITENVKDNYPNGCYLEGFTYVIPVNGDSENADVSHSIPILGFCGNWSDPSMFDRNSYIESRNNTNETVPYTKIPSDIYEINYLTYQDIEGNVLRQSQNPFAIVEDIPADRFAMGLDDTIYEMNLTLIRPAGALCFVVMKKDEDGNRHVLYMDGLRTHVTCAYPASRSEEYGGWSHTPIILSVHLSLEKMLALAGITEGETVEIGAVAAPEYYEKTPGEDITKEHLTMLIENGKLGRGAYMTTNVAIDSEAPTIMDESLTVDENKLDISVTVKDNQHVAYVGLYSTDGNKKYTSASPNMGEDKQFSCKLHSSYLQAGGEYVLVVGDYAGNYRMYRFTFGKKPDYKASGKALVYVRSNFTEGFGKGTWAYFDPKTFGVGTSYVIEKMTSVAYTDSEEVLAGADAAGNYLWQAFENGLLYAAPIDDLNNRKLVTDLFAAGMDTVRDLAFDPTGEKLYAVDGTDKLWQIDPMTGETRAIQEITGENGQETHLYGLAVGAAGRVCATCFEEKEDVNYLLHWNIADEKTGSGLEPVYEFSKVKLEQIKGRYISLSWKDDKRTALYAACADDLNSSNNARNYLYLISENKNGEWTVSKASNYGTYQSRLNFAVRGLISLSSVPKLDITANTGALTGVEICGAPKDMVAGDEAALSLAFKSWNANVDPAKITWTSDKNEVLSVDENGALTAKNEGTAKITAKYLSDDGEPITASCEIKVSPAPSIMVSALFREKDGHYYFETFDTDAPNERIPVSGPQSNYIVGTMNHRGDCLYLRNKSYGFRVDPITFRAEEARGTFNANYGQGDAAPGRTSGYISPFGYLGVIHGHVFLFGSNLMNFQEGFNEVSRHLEFGSGIPDSVAAIAYGKCIDNYRYNEKTGKTESADMYYLLTEDGILWSMTLYFDFEVQMDKIGSVKNVNLANVSQMREDATASMIYDNESGYLVLVSKNWSGKARVQVIDPETGSLLMTREFDDDVRQVGILYQYDYSNNPAVNGDRTKSGSTEIKAYSSKNTVVDEQNRTVTVTVPIKDTTNGLTELKYDSNVLTFKEAQRTLPYCSICDDKEGTVKFAFADSKVIGSDTVRFVFEYEPQEKEQTTNIKFEDKEKGDPKGESDLNTWNESLKIPAKPVERTLSSIEITSGPSKTEYLEGEENLDTAGLVVSAVYSDGTKDVLTSDQYQITGYSSEPGEHLITVTYQNFKATFKITVEEKSLKSIKISKDPVKMEYIEGTEFDPTGMELTLVYNNGTEKTITSGWEIGKYDFSTPGEAEVLIAYGGKSISLKVKVVAKSLVSIEVSKLPEKVIYLEGKNDLDVSGGKLTLRYNNGTAEQIDLLESMVKSVFDNTKVGKQTVKVSYEGYTATFEVTVKAKTLTKIEVSQMPSKTAYIQGDAFDPTGMALTLTYDNDISETVYEGWTLDYDFSKAGTQTVKVTYGGIETSITVTVIEKQVQPAETQEPTEPIQPAETQEPTEPIQPAETQEPTESIQPAETQEPTESIQPAETQKPTEPIQPAETQKPTEPIQPTESIQPAETQEPTESQQLDNSQSPIDPNPDKKDEDVGNPQTGDDSHIGLWLVLMFLSIGALAVIFVRREQR